MSYTPSSHLQLITELLLAVPARSGVTFHAIGVRWTNRTACSRCEVLGKVTIGHPDKYLTVYWPQYTQYTLHDGGKEDLLV